MSYQVQEKPKVDKPKNTTNTFLARLGILGELLSFFWRRKLYWLIPMILALVVLGVIIAAGGAGGAGLFIYTLF